MSRFCGYQANGFADLKIWRVLTELRLNAKHGTTLLRALLVLTNA